MIKEETEEGETLGKFESNNLLERCMVVGLQQLAQTRNNNNTRQEPDKDKGMRGLFTQCITFNVQYKK
jgi:hypothetical protein